MVSGWHIYVCNCLQNPIRPRKRTFRHQFIMYKPRTIVVHFPAKKINYSYVELLCHVNFVCQQNLRALMWWELFSVIYFITFLELFIESPINCAPGCVLLMDTKSSPILLQLCHSQNFVLCKQKFICLRVAAEQAIKGKMYHLQIYHVGSSLLWWKCHSAQPGRHVSFPRNTMEYFTPR